jgi:SAM-dependent methyltransferase
MGAIIVDELRDEFLAREFGRLGRKKLLLDLGCGNRPFRRIYEKYTEDSVGMDVPYSLHDLGSIQVYASGTDLPFRSGSFDMVLCTEVMEHVAEPESFLREIDRVLMPGGHLVMTVPFLVPVHEAPYDFYRYTIFGLKHLFSKTGLEIESATNFAEMNGVLLNYFVKIQLKVWNILGKALRIGVVNSLFNPFILLFVYLPQKGYVMIRRLLGKNPRIESMLQRTSETTIGYGIVACKREQDID